MAQSIFSSRAFNRKFNYSGNDLGVTYNTQVSLFKVWSPRAAAVHLVLYEAGDGGEILQELPMLRCAKGIWRIEVKGDLKGIYYTYKVDRGNGMQEVVDPYAKAVGVNGQRGMVVDLESTNPEGWEMHYRPQLVNPTDAIIYELHIRDLSTDSHGNIKNRGKFLGLTESGTTTINGDTTGIDHIKELGVTHVQLLPCYDFMTVDESELGRDSFNWGYDPQNYNVPEGSYATDPYHGEVRIKEFKTAIMALHENNLGVIMDVVYNHTAQGKNSNFNILMPNYYYRTKENGEFSNGSACGNEIASERFMVRKMIVDSVVYWAKEYKIDGFRFDLMGVLDIETMNTIRHELNKVNPSIILYGEGWAGGPCALDEKKRAVKKNAPFLHCIGVFNDDLRDGIRGHVFNSEETGFINNGINTEESIKLGIVGATKHREIDYKKVNYSDAPYAKEPGQCINYVSAHDNLTLWDKIEATCKEESLEEKIKMQKLSNAIVLTSQGVPFLHAGVEFARTKYGDENSYKSSDQINQLDWLRKAEFREVYKYYKGLILLRKMHPAFRMSRATEIQKHLSFLKMPKANMVGYRITRCSSKESWKEIVVLFNGNKERQKVTLESQKWHVVVNEKAAGIETLEILEGGEVLVPGRSAMVLVQP